MPNTVQASTGDTVEATLHTITPIATDGRHNAFCGLVRWRDFYYVSYRSGDGHGVFPGGDIVIQRCHQDDIRWTPRRVDGPSWQQVARLSTPGDNRDPHLVADRDMLWCYFATYYPRWGTDGKWCLTNATHDYLTSIVQTSNGTTWSKPCQVFRPNYWLWSVVSVPSTRGDQAPVWYGAAYHTGDIYDEMYSLHLIRSESRIWWTHRAVMRWSTDFQTRKPSEPCLFAPRQNSLACLARLENGCLYGTATFPYQEWTWSHLRITLHAPSVFQAHGKVFVVARSRRDELPGYVPPKQKSTAKTTGDGRKIPHDSSDEDVKPSLLRPMDLYCTALWEVCCVDAHETRPTLRHLLTLPSWGDNSYAGTVWDADLQELLVAYYSMHERQPLPEETALVSPADVFLARVGLTVV